jgi:hypothetical protein
MTQPKRTGQPVAIQRYTDVYCDGIKDPIPYPGSPSEFEEELENARVCSGGHGMRAMILRWRTASGEMVVLDLNRTKVLAMVERRVES